MLIPDLNFEPMDITPISEDRWRVVLFKQIGDEVKSVRADGALEFSHECLVTRPFELKGSFDEVSSRIYKDFDTLFRVNEEVETSGESSLESYKRSQKSLQSSDWYLIKVFEHLLSLESFKPFKEELLREFPDLDKKLSERKSDRKIVSDFLDFS